MRFPFLMAVVLGMVGCPKPEPVKPDNNNTGDNDMPAEAAKLAVTKTKPAAGHNPQAASPLLEIMEKEAKRWMSTPAVVEAQPKLYYLSYQIFDQRQIVLEAQSGALVTDTEEDQRQLDTVVRVGSPSMDNTTDLTSDPNGINQRMIRRGHVPMGTNPQAIREHLWIDTDRRYREAQLAYRQVEADARVRAKEERPPDFVASKPVFFVAKEKSVSFDKKKWIERLKECSRKAHDGVATRGTCRLEVERVHSYYINSEGSKIQTSHTRAQLAVGNGVKARDGMQLRRLEQVFAPTPAGLTDPKIIEDMVKKTVADLRALHDSPIVDPYVGPAILQGKAAGVFFHEVFGHRMEGHRQTSSESGQTFTSKIGKEIMPSWITVFDDPQLVTVNGTYLNGFYRYDDEGVPAERVTLVNNGVLRGFLQGRHPIKGFPTSNGHGRKSPGSFPVSRQGNLVVSVSRSVDEKELEKRLLAEVKKQGKPFGMVFTEISGGFTNTSRFLPQAFKVNPVMAYRIYPDGRRELVRGVDIVGTPLTALGSIMAASNKIETFNGMCGAESGWVPVSASAPSLLLKSLEVERGFKAVDRPPILAPPPNVTADKGGKR